MIKFEPSTKPKDDTATAENALADRFQKSSAASKRKFDSDGQLRRAEDTAKNNRLV
jgi:hypothetical protein